MNIKISRSLEVFEFFLPLPILEISLKALGEHSNFFVKIFMKKSAWKDSAFITIKE